MSSIVTEIEKRSRALSNLGLDTDKPDNITKGNLIVVIRSKKDAISNSYDANSKRLDTKNPFQLLNKFDSFSFSLLISLKKKVLA